MLDSVVAYHIESIIASLPNFGGTHAVLIPSVAESNMVLVTFPEEVVQSGTVGDYLSGIIKENNAVGTILVTPAIIPNLPKDDPYYEEFINGEIDPYTLPPDKKKDVIYIYAEILGPYKRVLTMQLDSRGRLDGTVKESQEKVPWFPLVWTNDLRN